MIVYTLKKVYPGLPKDWEKGMIIGHGDRSSASYYTPCNGKYTEKHIIPSHLLPEYWERTRFIFDVDKVVEPEVLFTTEDGIDVHIGDNLFLLGTSNWIITNLSPINAKITTPFKGSTGVEFKYFSTKEAAKEYVLMNKPALSVNDIKSLCATPKNIFNLMTTTEDKLIELVKQKHGNK